MKQTREITSLELKMWLENARYEYGQINEKECIRTLFEKSPGTAKMLKLLESISDTGYFNESFIVFDNGEEKVTLDGNRRLSLLKLSEYPDLVEKYKVSNEQLNKVKLITNVVCDVYDDVEKAYDHVENRHQGQSEGVGLIPWNSENKDNFNETRGRRVGFSKRIFDFFKNTSNPEYNFVRKNLKDITTIKRIFGAKCISKDKFHLSNSDGYDLDNAQHVGKINEMLKFFYEQGGNVGQVYNVDLTQALFKDISTIQDDMTPNALFKGPIEPLNKKELIENGMETDANDSEKSLLNSPTPKIPQVKSSSKNKLKFSQVNLFEWKSKGIDIDNNELKYYLNELTSYQINSNSANISKFLYQSAPVYYRIMLECAIGNFTSWIKMPVNQKKFNYNNVNIEIEFGKSKDVIFERFTGTSTMKESMVNTNKLHGILLLSKVMKSNNKVTILRKHTKRLNELALNNEASLSQFVDEINNIVHGSITSLDNNKLKNYDEATCLFLQIISTTMN